jgi:hypothetical protein
VVATPEAAAWLPALAGRRVIRVDPAQPEGLKQPALRDPRVRVIVSDALLRLTPFADRPWPVGEVFRTPRLTAYWIAP